MDAVSTKLFNILDVNLAIPMRVSTNAHIQELCLALGANFEFKELGRTGAKMLRALIACHNAQYATINEMEGAIRKVASEEYFPWQRFGGIQVGETITLRY